MIVAIAHARIRPDARDAFLAAIPAFLSATRGETGCIVYDLLECVDDPNHFVTLERWDDRGCIDAHMGAAHTQTFLGLVGASVAEAPSIEAVNVASIDRMM